MGEIDYQDWYPEVAPVMDTKQVAELLHTNEQIIRAWVREGTIPAHRKPGGRKFTFLRHQIFNWSSPTDTNLRPTAAKHIGTGS
ncbi:MAG TPA: helix-turn-helix domain-containing protein [Acidimicrobiia bacterium]|nr:helix-turn-helix domain-containing protein [Acidimicrobiia bacterium]